MHWSYIFLALTHRNIDVVWYNHIRLRSLNITVCYEYLIKKCSSQDSNVDRKFHVLKSFVFVFLQSSSKVRESKWVSDTFCPCFFATLFIVAWKMLPPLRRFLIGISPFAYYPLLPLHSWILLSFRVYVQMSVRLSVPSCYCQTFFRICFSCSLAWPINSLEPGKF